MILIINVYIKQKVSTNVHSQEDMEAIFVKAGFRIIHIESNTKKYTFPDLSSLLSNVLEFLSYLSFKFNILLSLCIKLIMPKFRNLYILQSIIQQSMLINQFNIFI